MNWVGVCDDTDIAWVPTSVAFAGPVLVNIHPKASYTVFCYQTYIYVMKLPMLKIVEINVLCLESDRFILPCLAAWSVKMSDNSCWSVSYCIIKIPAVVTNVGIRSLELLITLGIQMEMIVSLRPYKDIPEHVSTF